MDCPDTDGGSPGLRPARRRRRQPRPNHRRGQPECQRDHVAVRLGRRHDRLGLQRRLARRRRRLGARPDHRGQRGRHPAGALHQQPVRADHHPLARHRELRRHGRGAHLPAARPAGRDLRLRVPPPAGRPVLVPPSRAHLRPGREGGCTPGSWSRTRPRTRWSSRTWAAARSRSTSCSSTTSCSTPTTRSFPPSRSRTRCRTLSTTSTVAWATCSWSTVATRAASRCR